MRPTDHATWLLRNLYAAQEATIRTVMTQRTGSKLRKEYVKDVYCHISITSDIQWYHPYGRKLRETEEPLAESERWEWKSWLKTQHSKKLRPQHLVISLSGKLMGKQCKQWQTIFLGSKITADGDCSHEIKRCLLLGRKAMTNLDSILKSRDIILPTNAPLVKAMVFLEVMYRCENWTIKKADCLRIDAFELWC